jgi:hypothetical protein
MFNFKKLILNKDASESDPFVGIRRSASKDGMEFRLPRGFADFPENDFNATKDLFFRMYRTFKKFERDHSDEINIDENKKRKDNIETKRNGYRFLDSEDCDVVLYSKISVIENLLEAYEDLSLDVIERQVGREERIDYSKIDKYLDRAIYQEENVDEYVIYIDSMDLPKNVVQYNSSNLIDMFCFILNELNNELKQETDSRVRELSSKFKEQHLGCHQSLFDENTFEETMIALKDILDNINKSTAYKDNDYWRLYEAIESFLYGELDMSNPYEDGVFWGISNFWQIWEDMCNTYIFTHRDEYDIIYADTNIKINGNNVANCTCGSRHLFKKTDFENPFFIEFKRERRWLRPDLVYYAKLDAFFPFVKFDIINDNGNFIDFNICPVGISKEENEIYGLICDYFKIKRKGFRPNSGVKQKNSTLFKKYPKEEFFLKKKQRQDSFEKLNSIKILDYKYIDYKFLINKNKKIDTDITKQLCYEFCLKNMFSYQNILIKSQFIIPFYSDIKNDIVEEISSDTMYIRLKESKIEIFKASFYKMQDTYLNND